MKKKTDFLSDSMLLYLKMPLNAAALNIPLNRGAIQTIEIPIQVVRFSIGIFQFAGGYRVRKTEKKPVVVEEVFTTVIALNPLVILYTSPGKTAVKLPEAVFP